MAEPGYTFDAYDKMLHGEGVIDTPRTVQEFHQIIDYFHKITIPKDEEGQKKLFRRVRPFIEQIVQLQSGDIRDASVEPLRQNMLAILNEATGILPKQYYEATCDERIEVPYDKSQSTNPLKRNIVNSYIITNTVQLREWATKAQPGDVLAMTSTNHEMCICIREEGGRNVVDCYDPNHDHPITIDQEELKANRLPKTFDPFQSMHHKQWLKSFLVCQHIVPGDKDSITSKINIANTSIADLNLSDARSVLEAASYTLPKDDIVQLARRCTENMESAGVKDEDTALHCLMRGMCRENAVKAVLENITIDVNARNTNGLTALQYVDTNADSFKYLLQFPGIDAGVKDDQEKTLLHRAISGGFYPTIIEQLVCHDKIDINAKDKDGNTALHLLLKRTNIDLQKRAEVLEMLLKNPNIKVDMLNNQSNTILHLAASFGDKRIIEKILALPGIDINAKNKDGKTAIECAITNVNDANVIFAKLMDQKDIDLILNDSNGRSLLERTIDNSNANILKLLLLKQDISQRGLDNRSAVRYAIEEDAHHDVIKVLFATTDATNPTINKTYDDGLTPLHLAMRYGAFARVVKTLLSVPLIDINARDPEGNTALEYLVNAKPNHSATISILINASTEIDPKVLEICLTYEKLKDNARVIKAIQDWAMREQTISPEVQQMLDKYNVPYAKISCILGMSGIVDELKSVDKPISTHQDKPLPGYQVLPRSQSGSPNFSH